MMILVFNFMSLSPCRVFGYGLAKELSAEETELGCYLQACPDVKNRTVLSRPVPGLSDGVQSCAWDGFVSSEPCARVFSFYAMEITEWFVQSVCCYVFFFWRAALRRFTRPAR
tara:strand:- start:605 stop:943 length:339 start_codon:yes stop_codon:yes gene_type:complete